MGFLPSLAYALLMGALPMVEVIWHGRSPAALLLLFWFETVLLLVTGALRIVVHRRATGKAGHHASTSLISDPKAGADATRRGLGDANAYLRSFVGLTAIFTVFHGLFVVLLVFLFKIAGPLPWEDAKAALFYAITVQALFLAWDLPRIPGWSFAELGRNTGAVSLRVLVTQLGLIFGIPVAGMAGSPWGLLGTLVALRSLADASIAWLTGLVKRRDLPPGLARFLARRSKQSEESLEAEFDALKSGGSEVEALLEQPIGEALRGSGPVPARPSP